MLSCRSTSAEETIGYGAQLARLLQADDVILLDGDLGAGKTQFSKGVAAGLGVDDDVTSPTFNILLEYEGCELPLFHFDLYRLEDPQELEDIDFDGVLEGGGVSLVEWAGKFADDMPPECLQVTIRVSGEGGRRLELAGRGARGQQLEQAFSRLLAQG